MRRIACNPIPNAVDRRLGEVVRDMRTRHHMTQAQLGKAVGLHPTAISRLERGRLNVPLALIPQLARALLIPIRDLLPGSWLLES